MRRRHALLLACALLVPPQALRAGEAADLCREAAALAASGKDAEAAEGYRRALLLDPDQTDELYALGNLLLNRLGKADEAIPILRRYRELQPSVEIAGEWLRRAEDLVFQSALERNIVLLRPPTRVLTPAGLAELGSGTSPEARPAADTAAEGALTIVAFRALTGKVTEVAGGRVKIDIGRADGAQPGMEFNIRRAGTWVGMVKTVAVAEDESECLPLAGKREEERWEFQPGDQASQREDVLGSGLAEEAKERKEVLELQRQQQEFQSELGTLKDMEKELVRKLYQGDTPAEVTATADELRKLHDRYGKWRERIAEWTSGVLKSQEERLVGNPHLKAYRRKLEDRRRIENDEFAWKTIEFDLRMDAITFIFSEGATLKKEQQSLEEQGRRHQESATSLNKLIQDHNRTRFSSANEAQNASSALQQKINALKEEDSRFQKTVADFNQKVLKFRDRLEELLLPMAEAEEDLEAWRGSDSVFSVTSADRRESQTEGLLNLGRYQLALGRFPKAADTFRSLLALSPAGAVERAAGESLEHALLRQTLGGDKPAADTASFAPPLAARWEVPTGGLQGRMERREGSVLGFFGRETGTAIQSRRLADGTLDWEFAFPGALAGRWALRGDEVVFASSHGDLYRLRASDGSLLGRWAIKAPAKGFRRIDAHLTPSGAWWLAAGAEPGKGEPAELAVFTDFSAPGEHRLVRPADEGRILGLVGTESHALVLARTPAKAGDGARREPPASWLGTWKNTPEHNISMASSVLLTGVFPGPSWLALSLAENQHDPDKAAAHLVFDKGGKVQRRITFPGQEPVVEVIADGDAAYLLLMDGSVAAVNTKTMAVEWKIRGAAGALDRPHFAEFLPGDADELVVLAGAIDPPWRVKVINRQEGLMVTEAAIPGGADSRPVSAAGFLYLVERDGSLHAMDIAREEKVWSLDTGGTRSIFLPATIDRHVPGDGTLVASAADASLESWRRFRSPDTPGNSQPLLLCGDTLLYHDRVAGKLMALAPAAGKEVK